MTEPSKKPTEPETDPEKAAQPTQDPPDPFDPANLRLDASFLEAAGVKKLLTTVPVGKPNPQDFVRVHPEAAYRDVFATIEWKEDREFYVVVPALARELPDECVNVILHTCINQQGVTRLWPIKLAGPDGRLNEWHRSAQEAAEHAIEQWVRVKANKSLGAYETCVAAASYPDPEWPDVPFKELLRIGFRDRLIDRLDHPLVLKLRGLA